MREMISSSSISDDFEIVSHSSSEADLDMEWRNSVLSDEDNETDSVDEDSTHTLYGNGIILKLADIGEIDGESDEDDGVRDGSVKEPKQSASSKPAAETERKRESVPGGEDAAELNELAKPNPPLLPRFPLSSASINPRPVVPPYQFKGVLLFGPVKSISQLGLQIAERCKGIEAFFISEDYDFVPCPCKRSPTQTLKSRLASFSKLRADEILHVELEGEKPTPIQGLMKVRSKLGPRFLSSPSITVRSNNFQWIQGLADNNIEEYVDIVPADSSHAPISANFVLTTGFVIAAVVLAVLTSWTVVARYNGVQQQPAAAPTAFTPTIIEPISVPCELSTIAVSTKDAIAELIFTWYLSVYNTITTASNLVEELTLNVFSTLKKKYSDVKAGNR